MRSALASVLLLLTAACGTQPAPGAPATVDVAGHFRGSTVRFSVPDLPGDVSFAGTPAADGSALGGTFTQDGRRDPLVLLREP